MTSEGVRGHGRRRRRCLEPAANGVARAALCWLLTIPGGESGLLRVGKPLTWGQALPYVDYVR